MAFLQFLLINAAETFFKHSGFQLPFLIVVTKYIWLKKKSH